MVETIASCCSDRVPFVLTSDMAYVINGGDKSSCKFQEFVDLCCSALNVLRQHGNLFLNLFSLMVNSHIPGVNENALKYVQKALLPENTDAEVTAIFTRMIDESLRSTFTQINFFLHNLAQMKFSGHTEGALLSFIPKTYSIHTDGKISNVEIHGYQKRYNPEKYYIYILKVSRVNQTMSSFVFRRYSEFQELYHKLMVTFPLAKLPSLSSRVILGRTHVRSVAAARKEAVETFIKHLFSLEPEISESGGRVIARTTNGERTTGNMTCRKVTGEKVTVEKEGGTGGQEMREVDATGGKTNGRKEVRGDVTKRKSITRTMTGRKETGKKGTTEKAAGGKVSNQGDAKRRSYSEAVIEGALRTERNDIVYTFFHPMLRDEQDNLTKMKEKPCMPVRDRVIQSQIKLSLFYKNSVFTVMVMHVKDLVAQGDEAPDPYVKLYLLPDSTKQTKRKTKIAKGTFHPTYNEMLIYRMPVEEVSQRQLQVTVWSYDALKENEFLGAVVINLAEFNFSRTTTQWYCLHMHS
ncbi:hypothetical protein NP493_1722g00005 [Ridgeia piscesae]|uniref:Uncharacterized protein n=1 Tax=Ridgeia piscesae TaxID=27915 RepID=A0AAD9JUL2_RIDPI|nr:hypothetical protein NP493_1722g00005 [Ridgeia piscesae]